MGAPVSAEEGVVVSGSGETNALFVRFALGGDMEERGGEEGMHLGYISC